MSRCKSVFISYRHTPLDAGLAHEIADELGRAGHEVFIDTAISWGDEWSKCIEQALGSCDCFLVLISKESARSGSVFDEVSRAKTLCAQRGGRPLILPLRVGLRLEEEIPYELSCCLRSIQQETWSGAHDTERLKRVILNRLGDESASMSSEGLDGSVSRPRHAPWSGALSPESPYYVARDADHRALVALGSSRQLVSIRGAHQSGKTSLLHRLRASLRAVQGAHDGSAACALVDLQMIGVDSLHTLAEIWRAIADEVAIDLGIEHWLESRERTASSYRQLLDGFLQRFVLTRGVWRVVICLDEIDRLFVHPRKNDFFGSVRGLFNLGASDPVWRHVAWVLGSSTEPSFYIDDNHQSPFNIGERVELSAFTLEEVRALAEKFGLADDERVVHVFDFTGGRPLLTSECFRRLQAGAALPDVLRAEAFASSLRHYLLHFRSCPELASMMKDVVCSNVVRANTLEAYRLLATGLVTRNEAGLLVPAGALYRAFFAKEL